MAPPGGRRRRRPPATGQPSGLRRNHDGKRNAADLQAGDRVTLHGKITHLAKHCDHTGFTPTITVKKVDFNKPKH